MKSPRKLFMFKEPLREKIPKVSSGPNFPEFSLNSPNTHKYGPEKVPCMNTYHAVCPKIIYVSDILQFLIK